MVVDDQRQSGPGLQRDAVDAAADDEYLEQSHGSRPDAGRSYIVGPASREPNRLAGRSTNERDR